VHQKCSIRLETCVHGQQAIQGCHHSASAAAAFDIPPGWWTCQVQAASPTQRCCCCCGILCPATPCQPPAPLPLADNTWPGWTCTCVCVSTLGLKLPFPAVHSHAACWCGSRLPSVVWCYLQGADVVQLRLHVSHISQISLCCPAAHHPTTATTAGSTVMSKMTLAVCSCGSSEPDVNNRRGDSQACSRAAAHQW